MKLTLRLVLLILFAGFCGPKLYAQTNRYDDAFAKIDSLAGKQEVKAALESLSQLNTKARKEGNTGMIIKSVMYRRVFQAYLNGGDRIRQINSLREDVAVAKQPEKSILQSLLAESYWNYYQQNAYKIGDRTRIVGDTLNTNIETWPVSMLITEVTKLYEASLSNVALLQSIPTSSLEDLLVGDKNTRYLRPTLYDILAHEALKIFKNNYLYGVADNYFAQQKFEQRSKLIYQTLLDYHNKNNNKAAYLDAELGRLTMLQKGAWGATANIGYFKALQALREKAEGTEIYSDILFVLANLYKTDQVKSEKDQNNLLIAADLLERAIAAFPKSSGASKAKNLLEEIQASALSLNIQKLVPVNQQVRLSFDYKNIDSLYFAIYKVNLNQSRNLRLERPDNYQIFLRNSKMVTSWNKGLPVQKDYKIHALDDTIPELPAGNYVLLAQNHPLLDTLNDQLINRYVRFTVSDLAVSTRVTQENGREFKVLDAAYGKPQSDVRIEELLQLTLKESKAKIEIVNTDKEGFAHTKGFANNTSQAMAIKGTDSVLVEMGTYYGNYSDDGEDDEDDLEVILLTDRPIYRPGQTVFFKGIVLKKKPGVRTIVPSKKIEVTFDDVNNKEIKKESFVSNDYGTFQGSFLIPTGKLNGRMSISTDYGIIEVRVEEYKRPTFQVTFDAVSPNFKYNDTVRVKGKAASYSGYAIGNAMVVYNVRLANKQVALGQTKTAMDGTFEVDFYANRDSAIADYTEQYQVNVDVTDQAGETRSVNGYVAVGGKSLQLRGYGYEDRIFLSKPQEMTFSVKGQNGAPINAKVQIKWFKKIPEPLQGEGSWEKVLVDFRQEQIAKDGKVVFIFKEGDLKPGFYERIVTAIGENKDTVSINNSYRIFDSTPDSILTRDEWVVQEKRRVNSNDDIVFRLAALKDNSTIYYETSINGKTGKSGWVAVSRLSTFLKFPASEYTERFDIQFMMVRDGEWFRTDREVYIDDQSKQLDIKFLSFRDKLQPGEKETWKLKITNKAGEKQMAEMVATLYDASLNTFNNLNWNVWGRNNRKGVYEWQNTVDQYGGRGSAAYQNFTARTKPFERSYERFNSYGYTYYGSSSAILGDFLQQADVEYLKRSKLKATARLQSLKASGKVYGLVKDVLGYGLPAVQVRLNNKLISATDLNGVYSINAATGDELTFSAIGFITQRVKVAKLKRIDVLLKDAANSLNEVVIRGYVKRTRETTTGSSYIVSGKEVQDVPVGNVEQLLQGKVAGLNIQNNYPGVPTNEVKTGKPGPFSRIKPRTNFSETAFFYPQLRTNAAGEIDIEFTIPETLTKYSMLGFAHTKSFQTLLIGKELITQKQFAISANAPRFFREGDTILFSARLNNLAGKHLKGKAYLELIDAVTGNVINVFSAKTFSDKAFELADKSNAVLTWPLVIPTGVSAITYRIMAESGKYSDGEANTVPVLTNSILVTETLPLNVRGNTSKTFTMDKLLQSGKSTTLRNQSLTLEFTSNPVWYAVQALPYLMEYPYECAEQTMSRFYANSFATGIINSAPRIKTVFEEWQKNSSTSLASNLDKNAELKALLMEETPWVRNAGDAAEKKKRLGVLFDLNRMSAELKANYDKLAALQNPNGSFSWFKGMEADRYITQQIVLNISQLRYLKLIDEKSYPEINGMLNRALIYLDNTFVNEANNISSFRRFYAMPLHYLYARSYTKQINQEKTYTNALSISLNEIKTNWLKLNLYERGLAALVLHRYGQHNEAMKIVASLKEQSAQSDELGMYWPDNALGWWWYQSPVETQALMVEVFDEVANDANAVEEMKIWLLKNKQNNDWRTTKATTAACYALLMRGYNLLSESAEPEISIGGKSITQLDIPAPEKEAGTGYQKITIPGSAVKPQMGTISIKNNNKTIAWGGLYWQYFEKPEKVTNSGTGITIIKELFIQQQTKEGAQLIRLSPANVLKVGDLLKVRIEIRCDRSMEYLHLKDMRSSGFEPVNVLSQYKYQDGLGYYESTKDASTNFFIGYMPKGTYVFEYALRVSAAGNFSNGITSLQSMYAPEFSTHSEGIRVTVK
ncbi:MAG: MG2 domain-containing protein [Bacteroidota bacterium]